MQFTYVSYFFEFFIYIYIFLQENLLNKIVLKQNKSNLAIRLCLPNDVMTTVSSLGQNALRIISPDSLVSVVIGGHFGGGDHFDGGDHFGGVTRPLTLCKCLTIALT